MTGHDQIRIKYFLLFFAIHLYTIFSFNDADIECDKGSIDIALGQGLLSKFPKKPTTPDRQTELRKVVTRLKNKSAPGYDLISPEVLKERSKNP